MIDALKILQLGPPLLTSAEERERASMITAQDIAVARVVWAQSAPLALRDLLDAPKASVALLGL